MKKFFVSGFIVIALLVCMPAFASASVPVIYLDNEAVDFSDGQPFVDENERTQVAVGVLARLLDAKVEWNGETFSAHIQYAGTSIEIEIGEPAIRVNGERKPMDTVARLEGGRTYIPLRYVAEAFGMEITWDEATETINLTLPRSSADDDFAFKLLSYMPQDKNYMVSPFSLKMALAMTANGAQGSTQEEILDVLGISDLKQYNAFAAQFIEESSENEDVTLSIANSIWHNKDYYGIEELGFSETFAGLIETYYKGMAEEIDNASGAGRVNGWISGATNDKIKDVLKDDDVEKYLTLLVNTIYFKGDWLYQFTAESTLNDMFTDRDGKQSEIPFMNQLVHHSHYEDDSLAVLARPYEGREITMYIILEKEDGSITKERFEHAISNMQTKYVRLQLPKFKTETLHDNLIEVLEDMGINIVFDEREANLLNMYSIIPPENIFISLILQKTFIEVDEMGTEAAAATVIGGSGGSSGPPPEITEFICDRPFTYFIVHESTGEILFAGEYAYVN